MHQPLSVEFQGFYFCTMMPSSSVWFLPTYHSGWLNKCQREEDKLTAVSLHMHGSIVPNMQIYRTSWMLHAFCMERSGGAQWDAQNQDILMETSFTLWKVARNQKLYFFCTCWKNVVKLKSLCPCLEAIPSALLLNMQKPTPAKCDSWRRPEGSWQVKLKNENVADSKWQRPGFSV